MNSSIVQWAIKHQVTAQALAELQELFWLPAVLAPIEQKDESEAAVQARVRLEAAKKGLHLFRNNVGVLKDARGVPVRYGLANDSKALNARWKSSDLIGWRRVLITPEHVGSPIAQFVSRECKRPGWTYKGDEHEQAQLRWLQAVQADGGDACFATGEGTL